MFRAVVNIPRLKSRGYIHEYGLGKEYTELKDAAYGFRTLMQGVAHALPAEFFIGAIYGDNGKIITELFGGQFEEGPENEFPGNPEAVPWVFENEIYRKPSPNLNEQKSICRWDTFDVLSAENQHRKMIATKNVNDYMKNIPKFPDHIGQLDVIELD